MRAACTLLWITILGGTLQMTAAFGQTTYTWAGSNFGGDGTNITTAANWTTNGTAPAITLPNGSYGDIAQWDNQTTKNVVCVGNVFLPGTGFGTIGINLVVTTDQVNPVRVIPVSTFTSPIAINQITINSASAAFSLGDTSANVLQDIARPAGAVHDWINNSSAAAIIYPNILWEAGGGTVYTLEFDGTGNWLVTNSLASDNNGTLIEKSGTGTLYWNGPSLNSASPYGPITSPITINSGAMVIQWNDAQLNNVNFTNNSLLQYDAPGQTQTYNGVISGPGTNLISNGTLILTGVNTYTGPTIVSNGTLIASSTAGDLDLSGGNVAPGSTTAVDSLTIAGNLNIASGSVVVVLNKAASPSNSTITVTGAINNTGGTLAVTNAGLHLKTGDTFAIFNQPVSSMTIIPPAGITFTNNLAVNGSISVATVPAINPTNMAVQVSSSRVILSWPVDHLGWYLQAQTDSLAGGIGTNWVTIPNSDAFDSYTNSISPTNGAVFYRMVYP